MSTESVLKDWRFGQTQAERLVCDLLHVEGFESVDPQHPLGGPDGTKDLVCSRDGVRWIAAAYFPSTLPSFADIKSKFSHDLAGLSKNNATGFAFFLNQYLTIGQREELIKLAGAAPTEIYHLERVRGLLDAPKGCGLRLQYLRIPMSEEEQWSFWHAMNHDVGRQLAAQENRRELQFQTIEQKLDLVLARTRAIGFSLTQDRSHILKEDVENFDMPTASVSISAVCWLHRVITEDTNLPEAVRGRFRAVNVWIGPQASTAETATFVPIPPEEVPIRLTELLQWWRDRHRVLVGAGRYEILVSLAEFHHGFLKIHPFLDANGRLARVLLDQAARELLNRAVGREFTSDPSAYYLALQAADKGDMSQLITRLTAALQ